MNNDKRTIDNVSNTSDSLPSAKKNNDTQPFTTPSDGQQSTGEDSGQSAGTCAGPPSGQPSDEADPAEASHQADLLEARRSKKLKRVQKQLGTTMQGPMSEEGFMLFNYYIIIFINILL